MSFKATDFFGGDNVPESRRLIITAGAWAGQMLASLGLPLTILRKVLFWFATSHPERFTPERFPIFIAESPIGSIYGFPLGDEPGVKVANHSGGEPSDLETVDRNVRPGEEAEVAAWVQQFLSGVSAEVTADFARKGQSIGTRRR